MSPHRYACHNRPPISPGLLTVQEGWTDGGQRRMGSLPTNWLDVNCGHDFRQRDPACDGCRWQGKLPAAALEEVQASWARRQAIPIEVPR